ncbi:MAG: SCP2 sterol-binding domain-containing protein [Dehalococcoidia bacterium]|nr:SCP2 sterol-binding domain-containing protein [Dehalococcoidia bacterium]
MAAIYTTQWYEELKELLNGNPEVERNAPRGKYRVLAEILGDGSSPYLKEGEQRFFTVDLTDGRCTEYQEVTEAPPRKAFDFIFEVPASIFEGIAAGLVDPVNAGLKGTIKITGDMRILIRHADLVNVLYDIYAREVDTSWPSGRPPYGQN